MYKSKQRPGVFSTYVVSGKNGSGSSEKAVGLVATTDAGECGKMYKFTRLSTLGEVFGNSGNMWRMGEILFGGNVSKIYCIGIDSEADNMADLYSEGFELLELFEDIGAVVCDSEDIEVHKQMKKSVEKCSKSHKERVGFCCTSIEDAEVEAKQLDSERMCVASPLVSYGGSDEGCYLAAVYAAISTGSGDAAQNLNMSEFMGNFVMSETVDEEMLDQLIDGGVSVFEPMENGVRLIRAVTTKNMLGNASSGLGELSTVRIIDDVMVTIRNMLKTRLKGAKNSKSTLESIRTQTALELEEKLSREIISSYEAPLVYPSQDDPSICIVEISFTVMYVMHQIHLMAYISV